MLEMKYPNPKKNPQRKNLLKTSSLFFIKKINNNVNEKKFINQKPQGGKLNEVINPKKIIYKISI